MADTKPEPKKPTAFRRHIKRLRTVLKAIHNFGASFERHSGFIHSLNEKYLTAAIEELDIPPNSDFLDYGCRIGTFTLSKFVPVAEEKNLKIFGVEKCAAHYQHAITNHAHDRITYVNEDILSGSFSLKDKKFSTVISIYYIHTVKNYRAVLEKLYNMLEDGRKCCLFIVSMCDDYFQFVKMLQDSSEWKSVGDQIPTPDWILARWAGRDHTEIIKGAVTSAGFQIKSFQMVDEYTIFASKEDCAEFLLASCMAESAECLPSSELYKKLEAEYVQFLKERATETCGGACGSGPRRHRLDYEMALIVAEK